MRKSLYGVVAAIIIAVLAFGLYASAPYLGGVFGLNSGNTGTGKTLGTSQTSTYDCGYPSSSTQLTCDKLPAGYTIAPRLSGAPPVVCPTGMSDSACQLFKQTYGNGVCDPNETSSDAPLDCSCPGALTPDPYTGRCASPATVCQANEGLPVPVAVNQTNP
jgi:hypothetical protein